MKKSLFTLATVIAIITISIVGLSGNNHSINQAILNQHNYYRGIAGIPLMRWDNNIAANAQKWANHLKRTQNCQMAHSSHSARRNISGFRYIGENLYWAWSSANVRADASQGEKSVDSWYGEIRDFQYSKRGVVCPKRNKRQAIGHFTQVMWDKSTKLGCGYALCKGRGSSLLVVCQYGPGGNFNMRTTPPFNERAAAKLNAHPVNKKYGGLPRCDR